MKWLFNNYSIGIVLASLVFFTACSGSKEARTMKSSINGDWVLQTVDVEGINSKISAKVFNEADFNCFIGSNWNFVSNNSMGSYTLSGSPSGCSNITRNIRWSIYEPKGGEREFQFKRLDEKRNPLDDNNGFRLSVTALTDNTMQLKSAITFEGKAANMVYNFVKK